MAGPRLVLSGACASLEQLRWETEAHLRLGRQDSLEVVLHDTSVARLHAEIFYTPQGWMVRNLTDSSRYLTLLNGQRLERLPVQLRLGDVLQVGQLLVQVSELELAAPAEAGPLAPRPDPIQRIKISGTFVTIQATTQQTWEQALQAVALEGAQGSRHGRDLLTLLRTGHHLSNLASLEELLQSILEEALHALQAQRAAIVLASPSGELRLRAALAPGLKTTGQRCYSQTLAQRCFTAGESLLCQDVRIEAALASAGSVRHGSMASIICALIRSPRQRLGVLHLDRGPFQEPFTAHDFYLADAIAASVAVGIESAQLVDQQRDEFIQAVTSLARTVELRDQYTSDHTRRVTDYALLLAEELKLSAGERYQIQIGTPLHDIGKIGVDDSILRKPGQLTADEFEVMKTHTVKGALILQAIRNLQPMIPIVRHHHERWDGTGYPDRLAGDAIPATARVVAVADAFDAMTSDRPYRQAMPAARAFHELETRAGTHFDPHCVQAFLRLRPRVETLLAGGEVVGCSSTSTT